MTVLVRSLHEDTLCGLLSIEFRLVELIRVTHPKKNLKSAVLGA